MKSKAIVLASLLVGVAAVGWGQNPVITSFQGNGQVTWTNGLNTNAAYHMEWAASLDGPWYRSFQNLNYIEAQSNTSFVAFVPMFYRVVMGTNPPPSGMELIDSGAFQMGYPDFNPAGTSRSVFVSAFYMDRYHITKAVWDKVRTWGTTNGYTDIAAGWCGSDSTGTRSNSLNHPVVYITWQDCVKWCNARSEMGKLTPVYYTNATYSSVYRTGTNTIQSGWVKWNANGYRLPTEAEWEKAARGGLVSKTYPWGDAIDGSMANYANSGDPYDNGTTPVGYYNGSQIPAGQDMANGYGLYDMAGNVYQFCWDWYGDNPPSDGSVDPRGPNSDTNGNRRVDRGGPWLNGVPSPYLRTAWRGAWDQATPQNIVGFRCVRSY